MFNRKNYFIPILASVLFLGLALPVSARAGGISSGGGDAYAAEFVHLGDEIFNMLKRVPVRGVPVANFGAVLRRTRVFSQERVSLNGRELDAVNTPTENRVVLSRSRWRQLRDFPRNKLALVAHEYFSLMGLDDRSYAISNSIFSRPGDPVVTYTCDAFRDFAAFGKFHLQFLVYKDLYVAQVTDEKGYSVDETGGFAPIYTYGMHSSGSDPSAWAGEWLVTINALFSTRIVSLEYSDRAKSGYFRTMDVRSLNPVDILKSAIYCKVTRN